MNCKDRIYYILFDTRPTVIEPALHNSNYFTASEIL